MEKSFEEYFNETDGQPFNYNGKKIQLSLHLKPDNLSKYRIDNFQTKSDWKQGIVVRALKGELHHNGTKNTAFVFWQDNFNEHIDFEYINGEKLIIYNVWDTGNGVMQAGHNGAGIFIEETNDGGLIFNCNDAFPDGSMNDLVFTIKKLNKNYR
ncbi:hypothetical protein [Hyunsoonleella ulvae]|uniref:hypothetical protein n=1 Tax=Hyunsoonleella ulvae TaxID=2799948 RepID=UPI00193993A2|nr:hypothetical protein [Hyunsoonleella ulvae]